MSSLIEICSPRPRLGTSLCNFCRLCLYEITRGLETSNRVQQPTGCTESSQSFLGQSAMTWPYPLHLKHLSFDRYFCLLWSLPPHSQSVVRFCPRAGVAEARTEAHPPEPPTASGPTTSVMIAQYTTTSCTASYLFWSVHFRRLAVFWLPLLDTQKLTTSSRHQKTGSPLC